MRQACRVIAAALIGFSFAANAQIHQVPPELWDRPRTARAIIEQEPIKRAVGAALAQPAAQLIIRHGGGQEPMLQAEELRSWLGALAIDTKRIVLRNDLPAGAPIQIEIVQ